jgi:Cu/Ag efflux protein CusF
MSLCRLTPLAVVVAAIVSGSTLALAQAPKGATVVASTQVTATVTKIDQKTREVTLKAEDGREHSFVVDPAVKNLAQVNAGDKVVATYTEALAYEVKKGGTAGASAAVGGGTAEPGATPAGVVARQVTITVSITAIDPKVPSVTFKGPQGNTRTIKIKDPAKLQGVSVGDTVQLTYTEAMAIKIEKAAK